MALKVGEYDGWSPSENQAGNELPSQWSNGDEAQSVCPNCGAGFPIEEARCPYCGALNPYGAERAYMGALDSIRSKTDDLDDNAEEGFKNSLKRNAKRTVAVIIVVVAALATLFLIVNCMSRGEERRDLQDFQARETFREQYFEELDRLYEAGDDDALSAYVWSLSDDPGFDALFSWNHADFLEVHDGWESLRSAEGFIKSGECGIDDYTWSVSLALRLAQLDGNSEPKLSQDEEERAAGYRAYAWQFLREVLQMGDEEIRAFADEAKGAQGNVQEEELRRSLEVRLQQLGTP